MKTEITKGPWIFYERRGCVQGECSTFGISAPPPNHWIIPPLNINPANVRLMASAPALLSALIGAEKAINKALQFVPADNEAHYLGEWLIEIRSVIAEAKGES